MLFCAYVISFIILPLGDAEFAVKVLRPMGCTVLQTDTTTTVTGPKQLLPLPHIDMETMTDAFMTAVVLAAVARNPNDADDNVTRITGIANQRVKECDRIAAMIEQLERLGVKGSELPDGLEIHGIDRVLLKNISPSGIKCYDDHRIAMSFSVLGCGFPSSASSAAAGLIVTEKRCVEKTWPSWWDTLQNTLLFDTVGVDLELPHHDSKNSLSMTKTRSIINPEKSIILIGMRGAGKTHMGRAGASFLSRKFVDMDEYLESHANMSIPEFIKQHGWPAFRSLEAKCLEKVMHENGTGLVIACGGGIVEGEACRKALKAWDGLVVHIKRDISSIEAYLNIDTTRPMYGEDMRAVWQRREPWYNESSNSQFFVLSSSTVSTSRTSGNHYEKVEKAFGQFLNFKLSPNAFVMPSLDASSYFVSLTSPNVKLMDSVIDNILIGANAIELRVDLLDNWKSDFVLEQVALIRVLSSLPIVFTVRTKKQGGKFPDDAFAAMLELLELGIKCGCEYVDVELSPPYDRFQGLLQSKGNCRIIGSYHDTLGLDSWDKEGVMAKKYVEFHEHCDIIKLIGRAKKFEDNFALCEFGKRIVPSFTWLGEKPIIALLMGPEGQLSRSLNTFLSPVTHPLLTNAAAPGQVSIYDIHKVRYGIGMLPSKLFCLFGYPITQSMSPTLHNSGFEALGLPYTYSLEETDDIERVKSVMQTMHGASVTIPLKVDVLNSGLCSYIDPAAKTIGAINTLVKQPDGTISGYNTDWIGIKRKILKYLPASASNVVGIVLGAGGTSRAALYALGDLPQVKHIKIWNRTFSKAEDLAREFKAEAVADLMSLLTPQTVVDNQAARPVYVVIGTIPASAQVDLPLKNMFQVCPASSYDFGIALDMAYRPRDTPFLLATRSLVPSKKWYRVEGIAVLLEQGYEQFQLWTGMEAPRGLIHGRVMEKYE